MKCIHLYGIAEVRRENFLITYPGIVLTGALLNGIFFTEIIVKRKTSKPSTGGQIIGAFRVKHRKGEILI